jgi:hypothetical protein
VRTRASSLRGSSVARHTGSKGSAKGFNCCCLAVHNDVNERSMDNRKIEIQNSNFLPVMNLEIPMQILSRCLVEVTLSMWRCFIVRVALSRSA